MEIQVSMLLFSGNASFIRDILMIYNVIVIFYTVNINVVSHFHVFL